MKERSQNSRFLGRHVIVVIVMSFLFVFFLLVLLKTKWTNERRDETSLKDNHCHLEHIGHGFTTRLVFIYSEIK